MNLNGASIPDLWALMAVLADALMKASGQDRIRIGSEALLDPPPIELFRSYDIDGVTVRRAAPPPGRRPGPIWAEAIIETQGEIEQ